MWELLSWLLKGERFDFKPNSLHYSHEKYMENSLENVEVDLQA